MLRKYTIKRIDIDYYTMTEQELVITRGGYKWDFVCSSGCRFPERDIPEQAQKRDPRIPLKRNGQSYTFFACVYRFPEPRLMGKFEDYTSAYGWEES